MKLKGPRSGISMEDMYRDGTLASLFVEEHELGTEEHYSCCNQENTSFSVSLILDIRSNISKITGQVLKYVLNHIVLDSFHVALGETGKI